MTDSTSVLGNLLWRPDGSPTEIDSYAKFVKAEKGFDWANDYHQLWLWSVQEKGSFWSSLWDWHEVIGVKGERLLINAGQMPGARFFPDASLNYAQNMLADADNRSALVAHCEDGHCKRFTRAELKTSVMALAGWMQTRGITKGDRVAAYLPNGEHALIAMLATAAIGAIFSSCSPDFGLTGVSDRFGQITPKLLIAADGYRYNGKVIDRLDNIAELEKEQVAYSVATDVGGGTSFSMLQTLSEAYKVCQLQGNKLSALKSLYLATLGNAKTLQLEDKIGTLEAGTEADFIVLDFNCTPLMTLKQSKCKTLAEKLFAMIILGDDRAVKETYVAGQCLHQR